MKYRTDLTAERLRELLSYCPDTGVFTWRVCPNKCGRVRIGSVAGRIHRDGHRIITIEGRQLYAHRLAFLYVHSRWPTECIDHIDGNPSNNRITNLREATAAQNIVNSRQRLNISGLRGAYLYQGKYNATITVGGKVRHLGRFSTAEEAHAVYLRASKEIHGDFVRAA